MSQITVPCSGCGQKYALKDSHVGKRVRCKKCETVFLVEDPNAAPEPELDVFGLDEQLDDPWSAPSSSPKDPFEDEEDDLPAVHRPKRTKPSSARKRSRGDSGEAVPEAAKIALLIFAGGGLAGALLMQLAQGPGMILFLVCMFGTIILMLISAIWVHVEAFRTGVLNGILGLFVPFYLLGLIVKYWSEMRRPVFTTLLSYGLMIVFVIAMVFLDPNGDVGQNPGGGPAFGNGNPARVQAGPPIGPNFGPGGPAFVPPDFPAPPEPIFAGPPGGPPFGPRPGFGGPDGPPFGPGGPSFGPGGPPSGPGEMAFGPGGPGRPAFGAPEGPGEDAFRSAFGGPEAQGEEAFGSNFGRPGAGLADAPGMDPGPGLGFSPRFGPRSNASITEHRTALLNVSTAASRASAALSGLAIRGNDPSAWTNLQEATDQLRREIEGYQALPALPDADRQRLQRQQGMMISSTLRHLSTMTDRARQRASRSPQAGLIDEPRALLAEFAESFGLTPGR